MEIRSAADKVELYFVKFSVEHFGNGPVVRDIAAFFGLSKARSHALLRDLLLAQRLKQLDGSNYVPESKYIPPRRLHDRLSGWEEYSDAQLIEVSKSFLTRDKVELIFARYSTVHFGNAPSAQKIAMALDLCKNRVIQCLHELRDVGRVRKVDHNLVLSDSMYLPPAHLKDDLSHSAQLLALPHGIRVKGGMRIAMSDLQKMYRSQKGKCWWCGTALDGVYQIDHRLASAKGGTNAIGNLCLSCIDCNQHKSDKLPWEFNGRLL